LRSPVLAPLRRGRCKTFACRRLWHDTAGFALRDHDLALSEQGGTWRLERLHPGHAADWPPAGTAPILAQGTNAALPHRRLTPAILAALVPVAAFAGTTRRMTLLLGGEAAQLDVLQGALRGMMADHPVCRLILAGPPAACATLAGQLSLQIPLAVPRVGLAAHAIAGAGGTACPPRQLGAPEIPSGITVSDALVLVIAHLTDVILHWAAEIPSAAGAAPDPEPVHQMRVAVRRLRSGLAIFRRAIPGELAASLFRELGESLKTLAAILGAARDWDVFLDGTGAQVAAAFAGDRRIAALLVAAGRKRQAAYAALHVYLGDPAWLQFAMRLALLPTARPWAPPDVAGSQSSSLDGPERDEFGEPRQPDPDAAILAAPAAVFAAQALQRSFRRTAAFGEELAGLSPETLHDARKQAKRLRYACEFFAPLFPPKPARRFLARLEEVQETLGAVNDGHVAAVLMAELAPDGRFATGVVQGYVAAISAPAARRAGKAWKKLLTQDVFWD
jgi:triphosphatase